MNEKILIASDIHGSAVWCKKLLDFYYAQQPTTLVLLGDILYHGPRNDLPDGYAPKEVISLLNPLKENVICVRGNCDAEVDQMVLSFPILSDSAIVYSFGKKLFLTHGHLFNSDILPPLSKGDILLNGHFHVPCHKLLNNGITYINCGSVSIPKENSPHSCLIYEDKKFKWYDLENQKFYDEYSL